MDMARTSILPNPENCSLFELDIAIKATPNQRSQFRLQAIKMLLMAFRPEVVAEFFNISRRTLRSWVRRFNARGIDGLIEGSREGRPRKISSLQGEHYKQLLEEPEQVGEKHWTARKFHGYLRQELQHEVGYSTVVRWLHENDFRLKVPRSWPERQDEAARQAFLEELRNYLQDHQIDIWYLDETGIEGDPRPRRRWVKKEEKAKLPYKGQHIRMNVTGIICPRKGQFYALEFTHTDSVTLQVFLDYANADLKLTRPRNLLICDNASWHKNKSINWGKFERVFLPPYSPDFNPIERLWLLIKAEWFTDFIAKSREDLMQRMDKALTWAIDRNDGNKKTCAI